MKNNKYIIDKNNITSPIKETYVDFRFLDKDICSSLQRYASQFNSSANLIYKDTIDKLKKIIVL